MDPLPPPVELWWPSVRFNWSLLFVHWPVGVLVIRSGFRSRVSSRKIWMPSCQIVCHCLVWSSSVCWICKQCSSTQSLVLLSPWLLPEPLLLPTLWNSQLLWVRILPAFYLGVEGPLCRSPTAQMAMERLWSSFSLLGFYGCSYTFGTCHISWRSPLLPFALLARSSLSW